MASRGKVRHHRDMTKVTRARLMALLAGPTDTQSEVINLIVALRKSLEEYDGRYDALGFFCDWALHAKLTQTKAMHILAEADAVVDALVTRHPPPDVQMRRLR